MGVGTLDRSASTGIVALALVATAVLVDCSHDTDLSRRSGPLAIPLGYDAYEAWDRWSTLRIGTRTSMRSTCDRNGGNDAADASHFIRESDHGLVTLDVEGTGVLSFVRTNAWHGSPWQYTVDGARTVVSETSTADPDHPVAGSTFLPADRFPSPLAETWSTTRGADLSWVRVPFTSSFELAYGRAHYGTGYYIFQSVALGNDDITAPIEAWGAASIPPASVRDLFDRAGTDIAPTSGLTSDRGVVNIAGGGASAVVDDVHGAGTIRALHFVVPRASAIAFGRATLRITWDDRAQPSVDAPVALFFGAGTLYNRDDHEWLVKAFPVSVRFPPGGSDVELATYFPMPFASRAKIELVSNEAVGDVTWDLRRYEEPPKEQFGYLHASYRDHPAPKLGEDNVLLDTSGVEGQGEWCGSVVGTSVIFSHDAVLGTLEGDPRFFFDDSGSPQVQGTGTEEWGGGGDYWGGLTTTLPFAGHPVGAPSAKDALTPDDRIESLYRFLLGDIMPFGRRARVNLEHGGNDESNEHYESVTYWYGWPDPCLVLADAVDVGDPADEARHGYVAVGASAPEEITSIYDLGPEPPGGTPIPTMTDSGRTITTSSELTIAVPANNVGLLLRRTLDYSHPDQRAEVYVADADHLDRGYAYAGTWYLAGSTRSLFALPKEETGVAVPAVVESRRRWRDDELLIARKLTQGKTRLRIRVQVAPRPKPLLLGEAPPATAGVWSEFRYTAYAWTLPRSASGTPGP